MTKHLIGKYIYKLLNLMLVFLGITFLSFLLTYLSPGDPAQILLNKSGMAVSKETLDAQRAEMGLDKPMLEQYGRWVVNALSGDLGTSYKSGRPVHSEIMENLPSTLALAGLSMVLIILISTPVGILCAYRSDGVFDNIFRVSSYLLSSLPSFFVALVAMYVFCLRLGILPVISKGNANGILLPALVLAATLSAWYIRQVRAIAMAELQKNYVEGLRSRGIRESRILFSHVLKNCMLPFLTLFAMSAGSLLGGSTIVESIFTWPGVGKLAVDAIVSRDYPVIQGYVLWMAIVFLVINGAVEVCYSIFDPRVRREKNA